MRTLTLLCLLISISRTPVYAEANSNPSTTKLSEPTITPPIKWNSDFRYRLQKELDGDDEERLTNRMRFRLGGNFTLAAETSLVFRLASFSKPESSAASANINMGDSSGFGFQRRFIGIDQAYIEHRLLPQSKFQIGKLPLNLSVTGKNQLILDSDLSPEGAALFSAWPYSQSTEFFANLAYYIIADNYGTTSPKKEETDNTLLIPQIGFKQKLETWNLLVVLSKFSFIGLKDDPFNHTCCAFGVAAKGRGNSEGDAPGTYKYDYDINNLGLEAKTQIEDIELSIFGEFFKNTAVKEGNNGHWIGFALNQGLWNFSYAHGQTEKDAVVSSMTDADFAKGETDQTGQQYSLQYKMNPQWTIGYSYFNSEYRKSTAPTVYKRSHLDSQWTF